MDFFLKKNATLPILKLSVVKDGRSDYKKFMDLVEVSSLFFSMVDVETGIPKITSKPAGFVEKTFIEPNSEPEYYIYYQFTSKDTNKVGRYEGQFLLKTPDGNLILPIREKLYINVQESFIADDLEYNACYTSEFPCCVNPPLTTTTTTCPCPSPTPTPTQPQELINPFVIDENVYLSPEEGFYLEFVDPNVDFSVDVSISSGSVITTCSVNLNYGFNQYITIPINVSLNLIGGGNYVVTTNVIIPPNQLSGTSITNNPDLSYFDLDKTGEISVGNIELPNTSYEINVEQLSFQQEPTPTPTPSPTPTNTPTPTPSPTNTPTPTPTPSPIPQAELTLYIQPLSGGQSIIFDGQTYTSDTTLTIDKNVSYNIEAVPQSGYVFVGWNIFGGSFSTTGQSTTVSVSLDSGANLAPSYAVDPNYDSLEEQMTSNLVNYQNSSVNDWVKITKEEYDSIFENVEGITKIGNTDEQINFRDGLTGYDTTTFGTVDVNTPLTIPTGYYIVGFITESWNQNGQIQFGYTTDYRTGSPTYMNNSPNIVGGIRSYYVRKRPSGTEGAPSTTNLYPVLNFLPPAYPNAVSGTFGWYTNDNGTNWVEVNPSFGNTKIQILITNTATWPT